jgi:hypothetical protein
MRTGRLAGCGKSPQRREPADRRKGMRGQNPANRSFVSLINFEAMIADKHPIRAIKRLCDEVLRAMSAHFDEIYAADGAPSIPPETLLKGKGLQALYTVRSKRGSAAKITKARGGYIKTGRFSAAC